MNIDCTDKCSYQINGKCELNTLPLNSAVNNLSKESNCPYFKPFEQ